MKIVCVCDDDYANFMYSQTLALRSVGADVECFKLVPHPFNYTNRAGVILKKKMQRIEADVYLFFHYHPRNKNIITPPPNAQVIYVHTGDNMRQHSADVIKEVRNSKNIIALPEFAGVLPNEYYLVGAIEPIGLSPQITGGNVFAHYPSSTTVKGSDVVMSAAREAGITINTGPLVPNKEHLERMSKCDVYVEMLSPTQGGKAYGSFGMTALEAASMGKVVITNNVTGEKLYQDTYGDCELVISNTRESLVSNMKKYSQENTHEKANKTLEWFNRTHSLKATGERLAWIIGQ